MRFVHRPNWSIGILSISVVEFFGDEGRNRKSFDVRP
jgi:hypothetical protein